MSIKQAKGNDFAILYEWLDYVWSQQLLDIVPRRLL